MMRLISGGFIVACTGTALAAVPAAGQQMSFTYSELAGTYDIGTGHFVSVAQGTTTGDVTRQTAPGGTAEFETNFVSLAPGSDVYVDLLVTVDSVNPGNIAQGVGYMVLTDADGDTIYGELYGAFLGSGNGDYFFDGFLDNVVLTTDDGAFHGTTGSADMDLPGDGPYEGIFVEISFNRSSGFFDTSFAANVLASGIILPSPGAVAMLGLGGVLMSRRRR